MKCFIRCLRFICSCILHFCVNPMGWKNVQSLIYCVFIILYTNNNLYTISNILCSNHFSIISFYNSKTKVFWLVNAFRVDNIWFCIERHQKKKRNAIQVIGFYQCCVPFRYLRSVCLVEYSMFYPFYLNCYFIKRKT